jgi:hypothetical protein
MATASAIVTSRRTSAKRGRDLFLTKTHDAVEEYPTQSPGANRETGTEPLMRLIDLSKT